MTCLTSSTLLSLLAELATLRRPALLLRTARFGIVDYHRDSDLRRILRMFEHGGFRAMLAGELPLEQVGEAHRRLEAREVAGKLALAV